MGKGLETLKNITNEKNKEKIIYILIAALIILISSSYIFKSEDKTASSSKENQTKTESYIYTYNEVEDKLSNILGKINGLSNVSCFITYKDQGTSVLAHDQDGKVIYNDVSSQKTAVIEKTLNPAVEGIIIVGNGFSSEEIKSKVSSAVASIFNIGVYKVQIFDKYE